MAERTCFNCVYCCCDPCLWLRWLGEGESIVPQCANHPLWPGQLHEVPGVPCRNYRSRPGMPPGDVRMIALTDGGYAYVDAADYEWLNQWQWRLCNGYAGRAEKGKIILMHRQIMQPPPGMIVDHADGNKTNNCRCNLRVCTCAQNSRNKRKQTRSRSRFKCVYYDKTIRRWFARCRYRGKNPVLGYFDTEIEAARAYDYQAVAWFGEFARLNLPHEWPPERRAVVYAQQQETDEQGKSDKEQVTSKKRRGRTKRGIKSVERGKVARLVTSDVRRPTKRASQPQPPDDPTPGTRGRRERKRRTKGNRRGE